MAESSVEIPTAPAWLSKLESRRELLSKSKIGHETGAGAPCTVCGDDCPGLDLHFWRKLCRNCKCRKDQHDVPNEDLSGWAQFELLGAVRSKPAFLKIKALENQAVHLDWVPPNVTQDLAMDYMNQLGMDQIPVTGSIAATRRKQQLEYQVPPHDLDPNLCDNLSNVEKSLFDEHIAKIVSNSGQGFVTRLGIKKGISAMVDLANSENVHGKKYDAIKHKDKVYDNTPRVLINDLYDEFGKPILESINRDTILQSILNSELVKGIRFDPVRRIGSKLQISDELGNKYTYSDNFTNEPGLSKVVKDKLTPMKINSQAVQSAVLHGWCYDKLLKDLDNFDIDYSEDLLLKPVKEFRAEYLDNEMFKNEMDNYAVQLGGEILIPFIYDNEKNMYATDKHGNDILTGRSDINDKPPEINYSTFPASNKNNDKGFLRNAVNPTGYTDQNYGQIANILDNFKPPENLQATQRLEEKYLENPPKCIPANISKPSLITKGIGDLQISPVHIKCQQCNTPITPGEVTVQTEKSGKNIFWHPKCFVCHSCNELLADLVYFYHKDKIYCARDYASILKIPRCKACDELIFTQEYTAAEGSNFHVKHFCCFNCDKPLADENYIPDDKTGQPLCLPCYEIYQAEKCEACHKPIAANEQGVAWSSVHWHTGCFNCAGRNCGKSLLGGRFMVKNNLPLCSKECFKSLQE